MVESRKTSLMLKHRDHNLGELIKAEKFDIVLCQRSSRLINVLLNLWYKM